MSWKQVPSRWGGYPPWPDRMLNRVIVMENGCWLLNHAGDRGEAPTVRQLLYEPGRPAAHAHKVVWEFFRGERVPPGMRLYGWCGDLFCVNPGHRLLVTPAEQQRIITWRHQGFDPWERCAAGHPRDPERPRSPTGQLRCRICETEDRTRWRQQNYERDRLADRKRKRRKAGWPTVE